MRYPKTANVFGMTGEGRTVADAKRDAQAKIERAMMGSYLPIVLSAGDETALIWRELEGWNYGFVRDGKLHAICSMGHNRDECERAARKHLGANVTIADISSVDDVAPIVVNAQDRADIFSNCQFQQRYRAFVASGMNERDAHACAGGFTQFVSDEGRAILASVA